MVGQRRHSQKLPGWVAVRGSGQLFGAALAREEERNQGAAPSWKISGTVEQSAVDENFSADVPVQIQFAKGAAQTVWVRTSDEPASFSVTLKQAPMRADIPAGTSVLATRK